MNVPVKKPSTATMPQHNALKKAPYRPVLGHCNTCLLYQYCYAQQVGSCAAVRGKRQSHSLAGDLVPALSVFARNELHGLVPSTPDLDVRTCALH